jgi:hypothetical protein
MLQLVSPVRAESQPVKGLRMQLLRIIVLWAMMAVAVAAIEIEVIARRPGLWVTAIVTVTAILLASLILWRSHWLLAHRHRKVETPTTPDWRHDRLRIAVRGILIAGFVSIELRPVHHWLHRPYYERQARNHGTTAGFCEYESEWMSRRADACSARARFGTPWNEPGEKAEALKSCPYPSDVPRHGSWSEQAAVWARAARKSKKAAERHSRMSDYYRAWNLEEVWNLSASARE